MATSVKSNPVAQEITTKPQVGPFSKKDEFGYILGDMGGSFVNLVIDAFYLTFCTYVLGVSPIFMGNLFLFSRLFDAFNDPVIGSFPDRWKIGKSGDKFKPYIKLFMWPLAIAMVMAFADVSSMGSTFTHVWVAAAYILYGIAYTGTSMPFGAMANVVTDDPVERTKLSRARSIGGSLVGLGALSIVPLVVWDGNGNAIPRAFFILGIIFAVLSLLSYRGLLNMTQERIVEKPKDEKEEKDFKYSQVLKDVMKNRPLLGVMLATVGSLIYITANSQLGSIMFLEYYGRPEILSIVNFSQIGVLVLAIPLVPKLSEWFGKKKTILFAVVFNLIIAGYLMFVPIANPYTFAVIFLIANSGQTIFTMLIWALVSDCLDFHEWKFGYRSDGSLYSIYTFSRKIGSTIASTLASYSLAWIGFVSGAATQTAEVSSNIRTLYTAVPVITTLFQIVGIGIVFNLTKSVTNEMYKELKANRSK